MQLEKRIDTKDWYQDWEEVGRGIDFSMAQDTIRCKFCRRDLIILPKSSIKKKPVWASGLNVNYEWTAPLGYRTSIIQANERCLCNQEECETIWAMSGRYIL